MSLPVHAEKITSCILSWSSLRCTCACTIMELQMEVSAMLYSYFFVLVSTYSSITSFQAVAILEMVYINNELYFLVLFTDNVVEFVHYRAMQHLSHDLYRSFFNPRRNSISWFRRAIMTAHYYNAKIKILFLHYLFLGNHLSSPVV